MTTSPGGDRAATTSLMPAWPDRLSRRQTGLFSLALAVVSASVLLAFSFAGQPAVLVMPAAALLLPVGGWWLALLVITIRRPAGAVLLAPLVVLLVAAAVAVNLPVKARFAAGAGAFDAVVRAAGPPPALLASNKAEEDRGWETFPAECPSRIASFSIRDCSAPPGGYLFWDPFGSSFIDDAGFAYFPGGVPDDVGTGWFESPVFVHLQGDWYAFSSSW